MITCNDCGRTQKYASGNNALNMPLCYNCAVKRESNHRIYTVGQYQVENMPQFDNEDLGRKFYIVQGCVQFIS